MCIPTTGAAAADASSTTSGGLYFLFTYARRQTDVTGKCDSSVTER